nr:hypothetical protein [Halorubrum halophilum]
MSDAPPAVGIRPWFIPHSTSGLTLRRELDGKAVRWLGSRRSGSGRFVSRRWFVTRWSLSHEITVEGTRPHPFRHINDPDTRVRANDSRMSREARTGDISTVEVSAREVSTGKIGVGEIGLLELDEARKGDE